MALAYLCKQWEKSRSMDQDVTVTAFVVDHKAREESTREANMVAGWLDNMGVFLASLPSLSPDGRIPALTASRPHDPNPEAVMARKQSHCV